MFLYLCRTCVGISDGYNRGITIYTEVLPHCSEMIFCFSKQSLEQMKYSSGALFLNILDICFLPSFKPLISYITSDKELYERIKKQIPNKKYNKLQNRPTERNIGH